MSKASRIYHSLTSQQKQLADEKNISATFRIKKWLGLLQKVSLYDQYLDQRIKRLQVLLIWSFVVGVISIFVFFATEFFEGTLISVLLIIVGIVLAVKRKKLKEGDINNYLRKFFMPVVAVLKDKAGEDARLAATLDFRNPRKAQKPQKSVVNGRNLSLYTPTYIIAKVMLKDGVLLEFVVSDDLKDFNWKKRSASGKTKYKSKTKMVHHCFIKMTLPKSEYTWNGTESPQVQIVDHNGDYFAKQKIKIKKLGKDNILNVNAFFAAIQSVYELFKPQNPMDEPPRKAEGEQMHYEDYSMIPYMWYGASFSDYDYDSFDYQDSGDMMYEDEGATVFDS